MEIGVSQSLVDDAAILLTIEGDSFTSFIKSLETDSGFVGKERLKEMFIPLVENDSKRALRVATFVDAVHERLREANQSLDGFVKDITGWLEENDKDGKRVSKDSVEELTNRVSQVLISYGCYLRQAKAEALSGKIGKPLESFELVCDLRPIFDSERKEIEGVMPLTWLKLVSTEYNGMPSTTEVVLTEENLLAIEETLKKAKQKLGELKKLVVEGIGKPIPVTSLARREKSDE